MNSLFAFTGHVDVNQEASNTNPFSFKNFLSDDLASRNKRVLQVFTVNRFLLFSCHTHTNNFLSVCTIILNYVIQTLMWHN